MVQRNAVMADGRGGSGGHSGDLPIHHSRYATVYLLPILTGLRADIIQTVSLTRHSMIIGITGGIGSGKSTLAQELARRGYAVYDCDLEAKRLIAGNAAVQTEIIALLGEEAFENGQYNTAYVSRRVFGEPKMLQALNAIVHPAVRSDIMRKAAEGTGGEVLFVESAVLYEAGLETLCEKVIEVEAPEAVRIARTIARDYQGDASDENRLKVRARIAAQRSYTQGKTNVLHLVNDGVRPVAELAEEALGWL